MPELPIDTARALPALGRPGFPWPLVRGAVDSALGVREANRRFIRAAQRGGPNPFEDMSREMGFAVNAAGPDPPSCGPLVVVANHPYGGADGIIMGAWLMRHRPDMLALTNESTAHIPGLRPYFIAVDAFARRERMAANAAALRRALAHLRKGGALLAFPSGTVSHWQPELRRVADPPWNPSIFELARRAGAAVLPVGIAGGNGAIFHGLGRLHPFLRTMLLPRVFLAQHGRQFHIRTGGLISSARLRELPDAAAVAQEARAESERQALSA